MNKKMLNNSGSAVVEATIVIPIFLFFILAIFTMCRCKLAEGIIYEAAAETAEYMAEYSYVSESGAFMPKLFFSKYIDDKKIVNEHIENGMDGVNFFGTVMRDNNDYVVLKVNYTLDINIPLFPDLKKQRNMTIRQRAYIGEGLDAKNKKSENDIYVYITDNKDVYHDSRFCTHLNLTVYSLTINSAKAKGYTPCKSCGKQCGSVVLVAEYGKRYHSNKNCGGLKRTVYRVRLSETGGIQGCQRCTN